MVKLISIMLYTFYHIKKYVYIKNENRNMTSEWRRGQQTSNVLNPESFCLTENLQLTAIFVSYVYHFVLKFLSFFHRPLPVCLTTDFLSCGIVKKLESHFHTKITDAKNVKLWVYCICNKMNLTSRVQPAVQSLFCVSSWFHNHIK